MISSRERRGSALSPTFEERGPLRVERIALRVGARPVSTFDALIPELARMRYRKDSRVRPRERYREHRAILEKTVTLDNRA
jgi:hypothetical protein